MNNIYNLLEQRNGKHKCEHFIPYSDIHGDIALVYCNHSDNKSDVEGNCCESLCPTGHFKKVKWLQSK